MQIFSIKAYRKTYQKIYQIFYIFDFTVVNDN